MVVPSKSRRVHPGHSLEERYPAIAVGALFSENPELDEIYGKLCHIAETLWLNHKADVCDECFFDVDCDDD